MQVAALAAPAALVHAVRPVSRELKVVAAASTSERDTGRSLPGGLLVAGLAKSERAGAAQAGGVLAIHGATLRVFAALLAGSLSISPPALARNTVFEGMYADPNHPGCNREIDSSGILRGIDPIPFARGAGCSKPGISAQAWKITGKVAADDKTILINFDEKDGSGEVFEGAWVGNGIKLPDGTLWKRIGPLPAASQVAGDYDDSSHPGCLRRVGADGTVYGEDPPGPLSPGSSCKPGDKTIPWQLPGSIVGPDQMIINFDPIDAEKQGPILAVLKPDGALVTRNGVWTKK